MTAALKRRAALTVATVGPPKTSRDNAVASINSQLETSTAEATRKFTSQKLDWINAIASHPRCKDRHVRFAVVIAKHVNERRRTAVVSDVTLQDLLPGFSRTKLYEVRTDLEAWGIIKCAVPGIGRPTVYGMRGEFIEQVNEYLRMKAEEREERRAERDRQREARLSHVRKSEHANAL